MTLRETLRKGLEKVTLIGMIAGGVGFLYLANFNNNTNVKRFSQLERELNVPIRTLPLDPVAADHYQELQHEYAQLRTLPEVVQFNNFRDYADLSLYAAMCSGIAWLTLNRKREQEEYKKNTPSPETNSASS